MVIDRRKALWAAGVSAVAAFAAACSSSSPPPSMTPVPTPPSQPLGPPDWNALRDKLSGGLLQPKDPNFAVAKQSFNPLFDQKSPAAVARCTTPDQVRECILATAGRVPVAARSGGHSYAGYSMPEDGLIIDLSKLSAIEMKGNNTISIGAGAKLKDIYQVLADSGRCLPAGTCPTVGIAGLTLGGGVGVLTRKFGLTCDHLLSAELIAADGRAVTAAVDSEPDLYWGLRGGGGGNFGVVTSFTFSTEPAPDVVVFSLKFSAGQASAVFGAWQEWVTKAPRELWSNVVLSAATQPACRVGGCYVGGVAQLNSLLNGLVNQAGVQPSSRFVQPKDYRAAMSYFSGSQERQPFVATSRILSEPVSSPDKVISLVAKQKAMDITFDALGGAVSDVAPSDTAFWHRKALAAVQIYSSATAQTQQERSAAIGEVAAGLAELGIDGGYVNYIDPALPNWADSYYGGNLPRLKQVAQKYDPTKVFGFVQNVQSG